MPPGGSQIFKTNKRLPNQLNKYNKKTLSVVETWQSDKQMKLIQNAFHNNKVLKMWTLGIIKGNYSWKKPINKLNVSWNKLNEQLSQTKQIKRINRNPN